MPSVGLGVKNPEDVVCKPAMSSPRTFADLADNPLGREGSKEIGGAGLADTQPLLDGFDSHDRVSEQEVYHFDRAAPASLKGQPIFFAKVGQFFSPADCIICLPSNPSEEEIEPLIDLSTFTDGLEPVVVLLFAVVKVARYV